MNKHSRLMKSNGQEQPKKSTRTKGSATLGLKSVEPAPALRKNQVVVELEHPGAQQVSVAGSFNAWHPEATPLKSVAPGRWSGNLELAPGRHEYLFVVDGQWLPDPNAPEAVQNPFGGRNSVLIVRE